jgi:hypothetical protein
MNKQTQKANVLKLRECSRRWLRAAAMLVVISLASACAYGAARWVMWRFEIGTNLPLAPYSVCEECGAVDAPAGGRCARAFSQAAPAAGIPAEKSKCALPACASLLEVGTGAACQTESGIGGKCVKGDDENEK